eukprot:10072123-Prorocentrum_lima.AAC.1
MRMLAEEGRNLMPGMRRARKAVKRQSIACQKVFHASCLSQPGEDEGSDVLPAVIATTAFS